MINMFNKEFVQPYYLDKLDPEDLQEIQDYISKLKDTDYTHNEFDHNDGHTNQYFKKYRSCEIHYPKSSSVFFRVGKKFFEKINKKYYRYDLKNIYEFQLIKYHEGGNYNWHCDYGVSPRPWVVRKLSMSIQLTDPEKYHGGELELIDYGNRSIMISNALGTVAVFDSKVPHKAHPIAFGERIVLVGWASGPRLR